MKLVPDDNLLGWVAKRVGCELEDFLPGRACGVYGSDGELRGAAAFHGWQPRSRSVVMAWASADRGPWLSRRILGRMCEHAYGTLDCVRITATVDVENTRSSTILLGLGFKEEGRVRLGWNGERDMLIFGMLRSECRWYPLEGKRDVEQQEAGLHGRDEAVAGRPEPEQGEPVHALRVEGLEGRRAPCQPEPGGPAAAGREPAAAGGPGEQPRRGRGHRRREEEPGRGGRPPAGVRARVA